MIFHINFALENQRRAPFSRDASLLRRMTNPIFCVRRSTCKSETGTILPRRFAPQPNDKPYFLRAKKHLKIRAGHHSPETLRSSDE